MSKKYSAPHFIFQNAFRLCLFCFPVLCFLASCTTPKNLIYFENLKKDTVLKHVATKDFELKIRKDDILSIAVQSTSPEVRDYNMIAATSIGTGTATAGGYALSPDGNIIFPKLGVIHAEGMTRRELANKLTKDLSPYLLNTIVTVNFVNQHVTMLGGVGSSQIVPIANEQLTILDALALSGDIKQTGRKDNVLVIRQTDNGKQFKRINLNDHSVFFSPFFYLQPNDIVYVEPTREKHQLTTQELLTYITTGISILFLILNSTNK